MLKKNLLLTLILGMFLISLASCELIGVFKQTECINLPQTCEDCTYVTISSIQLPDSTISISEAEMTRHGTFFNYSYCDTTELGTYFVNGYGNENGLNRTWAYTFEITTTGSDFSISKILGYFLIFIFSLLIFAGFIYFGLTIPSDYRRDDITGYILSLNSLKYAKYFCFAFAYLTLVFISYYIWMITFSFLNMEFMAKIFQLIFYGLTILILPLFIIFILIIIMNLVKDKEIRNSLKRGLRIR